MNAVFVAANTAEQAYNAAPFVAIKLVKCAGGYFAFERYVDWMEFMVAHGRRVN